MRYGTEGQPDIGGGSREELCPLFKKPGLLRFLYKGNDSIL
jgi:hypothetical protein